MTRSELLVACRQAEGLAYHLSRALAARGPGARGLSIPLWHARRLRLTCLHTLADASESRAAIGHPRDLDRAGAARAKPSAGAL